jgi:hypothetical protein
MDWRAVADQIAAMCLTVAFAECIEFLMLLLLTSGIPVDVGAMHAGPLRTQLLDATARASLRSRQRRCR